MKILLNNNDLNEALYGVSNLGFVPTMGSLHKGHVSLIKNSQKQCKKTIVSIFINPTQFNNENDYKKYPKNNKKDLSILKRLKVNYVFLPKNKDIYNSKNKIKPKLIKKEKILCAKYRKGHFEGVLEVMSRLTKLIQPSKIYMGEKDFQQYFLVKRYMKKYSKTKIISCKTVRNNSKLALSSRNLHLKSKELKLAGNLAKNLISFKKKIIKNKNLKKLILYKKKELENFYNINIEYLELRNRKDLKLSNTIKNSKIFIAYYLNEIRLIDNF
jgi:pantoate--beta-alanine ligase